MAEVKGSSEWWRNVALDAAALAFDVADMNRTESERRRNQYDVSVYLDQCARAAERWQQEKGWDRPDAVVEFAEIAPLIIDGVDGWTAAGKALAAKRIPWHQRPTTPRRNRPRRRK